MIDAGKSVNDMAEITIREAITQGLAEAIETDDSVFIMGEDIGEYGGAYSITKGFLEKYGDKRIKDTPISEAAFVGRRYRCRGSRIATCCRVDVDELLARRV